MKETFDDAVAGDRVSAREYNKLTGAVEMLAGAGPPAGQQAVDVGGVSGEAQHVPGLVVVRITGIVVPESSNIYEDSLTDRTDVNGDTGADAFNAVVQVWDDDLPGWADSPAGDCAEVIVLDDQTGWRPLVVGDILPVFWKRTAGRYVPVETRESAIVLVSSGPDADGFYGGQIVAWASETETWISRGECYVLDVGL